MSDIKVVYCTDIAALCRRVCVHRQQPLGMVKIQGDHGRGVFKISAQFTPSNSVQMLQLLAVTADSNESMTTLKGMLDLLNLSALVDIGAELVFTGDRKFIQLVYGIKTGYSRYPCPWCRWYATGVTGDPVDARCADRDVLKDADDFVSLGSDRANSSRCHGQQGLPCVPPSLLQDPANRVSPCTLHIGLGLVNKIDQSMLRSAGEEVVTEELYRKANVTKSPYQGGTFEGNQCQRIVRSAAASGWSETHPLAPYRPLFEKLTRAPLGYFYNAPHWGGGYFEPLPL